MSPLTGSSFLVCSYSPGPASARPPESSSPLWASSPASGFAVNRPRLSRPWPALSFAARAAHNHLRTACALLGLPLPTILHRLTPAVPARPAGPAPPRYRVFRTAGGGQATLLGFVPSLVGLQPINIARAGRRGRGATLCGTNIRGA